MNYALIDTANTFFRARHIASRNSTVEEKVGMALHLTLASVNQVVKKFKITSLFLVTIVESNKKWNICLIRLFQ